jgi:hypothetical protein
MAGVELPNLGPIEPTEFGSHDSESERIDIGPIKNKLNNFDSFYIYRNNGQDIILVGENHDTKPKSDNIVDIIKLMMVAKYEKLPDIYTEETSKIPSSIRQKKSIKIPENYEPEFTSSKHSKFISHMDVLELSGYEYTGTNVRLNILLYEVIGQFFNENIILKNAKKAARKMYGSIKEGSIDPYVFLNNILIALVNLNVEELKKYDRQLSKYYKKIASNINLYNRYVTDRILPIKPSTIKKNRDILKLSKRLKHGIGRIRSHNITFKNQKIVKFLKNTLRKGIKHNQSNILRHDVIESITLSAFARFLKTILTSIDSQEKQTKISQYFREIYNYKKIFDGVIGIKVNKKGKTSYVELGDESIGEKYNINFDILLSYLVDLLTIYYLELSVTEKSNNVIIMLGDNHVKNIVKYLNYCGYEELYKFENILEKESASNESESSASNTSSVESKENKSGTKESENKSGASQYLSDETQSPQNMDEESDISLSSETEPSASGSNESHDDTKKLLTSTVLKKLLDDEDYRKLIDRHLFTEEIDYNVNMNGRDLLLEN